MMADLFNAIKKGKTSEPLIEQLPADVQNLHVDSSRPTNRFETSISKSPTAEKRSSRQSMSRTRFPATKTITRKSC